MVSARSPGAYSFQPAEYLIGNFRPSPCHSKRSKPLQDKRQLPVIAFRKNQEKLISTHADGEIASADGAIEGGGKFLQHHIPGGVTVAVVDVLELVEIQEHDGKRMLLASRARHFGNEPLLGKPSVVETGQGVNHGELAQDHGMMLLFRKLAPEPFDEHLLVDGVD